MKSLATYVNEQIQISDNMITEGFWDKLRTGFKAVTSLFTNPNSEVGKAVGLLQKATGTDFKNALQSVQQAYQTKKIDNIKQAIANLTAVTDKGNNIQAKNRLLTAVYAQLKALGIQNNNIDMQKEADAQLGAINQADPKAMQTVSTEIQKADQNQPVSQTAGIQATDPEVQALAKKMGKNPEEVVALLQQGGNSNAKPAVNPAPTA